MAEKDDGPTPRGPNGRELDPWGAELDEAGQKLHDLRRGGYTGWIDQNGDKAACPLCGQLGCTRPGFAGRCNR